MKSPCAESRGVARGEAAARSRPRTISRLHPDKAGQRASARSQTRCHFRQQTTVSLDLDRLPTLTRLQVEVMRDPAASLCARPRLIWYVLLFRPGWCVVVCCVGGVSRTASGVHLQLVSRPAGQQSSSRRQAAAGQSNTASRQSRTRDVGAAEARDFPQRPAHAAANVQHLVIVWRAQERVGHTLLQRLPACLHLVLTDRTRRSNPVKPRSGPRRTLCPGCSPSRSARKCSWRLSDSTWPSPAHRCAKWKDSPQPAEG